MSWGKDEIELFGFSRRLGVSVPKVNEAVNILCEIRYITKSDDQITVIKWGEKQSEYCQKLTKRQNQGGDRNPKSKKGVQTVSRQSPDSVHQEERRGEDKRGELGAHFPEAEIPSWEEFWAYCQTQSCLLPAKWYARDKFNAAEQDHWKGKSNWRAYAARCKGWWEADGRPMTQGGKNGKPNLASQPVGGRL